MREDNMLPEQRVQNCLAMRRPALWFALFTMAAITVLVAAVFLSGQEDSRIWADSALRQAAVVSAPLSKVEGLSNHQDIAGPVPGPAFQGEQVLTGTLYLPVVMRGFDPACPGCPPLFGIEMGGINNANGLQQAVEARMRWVRYNAIRWDVVQPNGPGTYDWGALSNVESHLLNAQQAGLWPIVIIRGTPSWAQKIPGYSCGPIKQDRLDEFATFVSAVVQRYKDPPYNVKFWELWNEPDNLPWGSPDSGYGCWGDTTDSAGYGGGYYAQMLKQAYPAVKAADPEAQVLIGGLLYAWYDPYGRPMINFLKGVLAAGGGDYFDILSYHAYSSPADEAYWIDEWGETILEAKTAHIRQVLAAYGYADKPMMCTEAGYRTFGDDSKLETQANYVVTDYVQAFSSGLKVHIWYGLKNDFQGTSLLNPDLSPKPACNAYQAMTQQLDGLYYQRRVPAGSNVEEHEFGNGTRTVWVIWTTDGYYHSVHFPTAWSPSGQFWVRNKYGEGTIWSDASDGHIDGQVTVQVSGSPFYVEPVQ
ncbi:MAG TPA: hypothetical protein EYP49_15675 [Anaerolineae bacterium]|nr:hypothetical protein [Anaerolineae bacterium]